MTDKTAKPDRTPLEESLFRLIKTRGPLSVAEYMSRVLADPDNGYYMTQTALGKDGDFTTAPEISQIFGELTGLWLIDAWRKTGSPETFNLIELGPGRGILMADILRTARIRPAFLRALRLWLVDTSAKLRHEQKKRLEEYDVKPVWAGSFGETAPGPALIVANEFFDCLPVRQYQYTPEGWRERLVGLSSGEDRLVFTSDSSPPSGSVILPSCAAPGDIHETSSAGNDLSGRIARRLHEHGGHALIIDYGYEKPAAGDTLQAVRHHRYWPPLCSPGKADISAHVDFSDIAGEAAGNGAVLHGPVRLGTFLENMGLPVRVEMLCKGKSAETARNIRSGARRISAPDQMGNLFKVLCISAPGTAIPAGF